MPPAVSSAGLARRLGGRSIGSAVEEVVSWTALAGEAQGLRRFDSAEAGPQRAARAEAQTAVADTDNVQRADQTGNDQADAQKPSRQAPNQERARSAAARSTPMNADTQEQGVH